MKAIWKYPFNIGDRFPLKMPLGAQILTVQVQKGSPCIWALVDVNEPDREVRWFQVYGTGHQHEEIGYRYIGTFQMDGGSMVFHLFEE